MHKDVAHPIAQHSPIILFIWLIPIVVLVWHIYIWIPLCKFGPEINNNICLVGRVLSEWYWLNCYADVFRPVDMSHEGKGKRKILLLRFC